jgi:hypothetical protein
MIPSLFEKLERHVGHHLALDARGLPTQNVVLTCVDCGEALLDLDAEGDAAAALVFAEPGPPRRPSPGVALALPVAA